MNRQEKENALRLINDDLTRLFEYLKKIEDNNHDPYTLEPYYVTFVVFYGRLFHKSKPSDWCLSASHLETKLSNPELYKIHDNLMVIRNRLVSHSDLNCIQKSETDSGFDFRDEGWYFREIYMLGRVCIWGADTSDEVKKETFSKITTLLQCIHKNHEELFTSKKDRGRE